MNLGGLDLNLMLALDALLEERSVTRAARKLALSQPTLSAALSRLRRHFGDELLVRDGADYRLTPLAMRLQQRARIAVTEAERLFASADTYDPRHTTRQFTIHISDYAVALLGSRVADILADEAPRSLLRFTSISSGSVDVPERTLLRNDVTIMPHGFLIDVPHQDLYQDTWVIVVSTDNPEIGEELTPEQLRQLHWVISYHGPTASTSAIRQLRMLGVEPHAQVIVESFLAIPALLAGTRRIALLQERIVKILPAAARVRVVPCPLDAGPLVQAMWWHPAHADDPEHAHLRSVIERAAASLDDYH